MNDYTMRSILVASDFSTHASHAANRAALLAEEYDATLRILTVVRENLLADLRRHLGVQGDATQRLLYGAKRDIEVLAANLRPAARAPECIVRVGDVETEILAAADHSDVLLLGAHGLSPTRDLLIGTTADRLLRKSRRPMIVVRTEPRAAYQRVLVAVDFSMQSLAALQFAALVAPSASMLVFHAFEGPYEGTSWRAAISETAVDELRSEYQDQALANMRNMIEKASLPAERASSTAAPGNPRRLVHTVAAEWGADLIVLGKQGHSAIGELLVGGVTRHTVSNAACDVAIVPDYLRL